MRKREREDKLAAADSQLSERAREVIVRAPLHRHVSYLSTVETRIGYLEKNRERERPQRNTKSLDVEMKHLRNPNRLQYLRNKLALNKQTSFSRLCS